AAPNLRHVRFCNNCFSKAGLTALTDGARFPNMRFLELDESAKKSAALKTAIADIVAGISLPRLLGLGLNGFPLGDTGAKALAGNPSLTSLKMLNLYSCAIGNKGFAALAHSPHLRELFGLDLARNKISKPTALLDPITLPKLRRIWLRNNK